MIVHVYIEKSLPQIDQLYSYRWEQGGSDPIGKRVVVPFGRGNRREVAVVLAAEEGTGEDLKAVISVPDHRSILSRHAIELGRRMREVFLTSYVQSFQPLLPKYVSGTIKEALYLAEEDEALASLFGEKDAIFLEDLNEKETAAIDAGIRRGTVKPRFVSTGAVQKRKRRVFAAVRTEAGDLPEKQRCVYELLLAEGPLSKKVVREKTGFSDSPLTSLQEKGLVKEENAPLPLPEEGPVLREEQARAIDAIRSAHGQNHLLFGETGSGKTEVYMRLCQEAIEDGKDAIVIVPEIGLATQTVHRFRARFPGKVEVLHSGLSAGEKAAAWLRIRERPGTIVVGARSAIFAPTNHLSYICIDEEQEESYDYQEGLRYDVREVAEIRARIDHAKVIYGSATPSVKTYARKDKDLTVHRLVQTATGSTARAPIRVVDMREELMRGNVEILSGEMMVGIADALQRKKQAILFINRRGYSHFVSCRSCGYVLECDACDIAMVYHKNTDRLHCHYCGLTKILPKTCPECGSPYLKQFGIGTEHVSEWIRKKFPKARVLRMDKDTMAQKGNYAAVYKKMQDKEVDILVGTQMLAKGFDFPDVVFVGVVAADLSLYISDYRAQEKTFQLLTQVSGRAGRGQAAGKVVIQTYNPDNYSIVFSKDRAYERFFHREMQARKQYGYPPYVHLLRIHIRGKGDLRPYGENWKRTLEAIGRHNHLDAIVLDPVEQPRIKNREHFTVTAKIYPEDYRVYMQALKRVLNHYYRNIAEKNIAVGISIDG